MVAVFNRHADHLVAIFETAASAATPTAIDVQSIFRRFTMDSFCDAFFGIDLGTLSKPSDFAQHFDYLQAFFSWRFRLDPFWRLWPFNSQMATSLAFLNKSFRDIIAAARADPNLAERTDLLAHYLRSTDEDGKPFTDEYLRDMLTNFLIAGRDTTASLLTWLFYCLEGHPEVQERMVEEIRRVVGMDAEPTPSQINELRYMKQVKNERKQDGRVRQNKTGGRGAGGGGASERKRNKESKRASAKAQHGT